MNNRKLFGSVTVPLPALLTYLGMFLWLSHRDLSLENLLLLDNGGLGIIDFGMALQVPRDREGRPGLLSPQGSCGKANYMSPEILLNERAFDGFKVDIWACGIILFM